MKIESDYSHQPKICTRRELFLQGGMGLGSLALSCLLAEEANAQNPAAGSHRPNLPGTLAPKQPMHPAKAKSVIFLFMNGGPSHVDTFDYKPALITSNGQRVRDNRALMQSPFTFKRSGKAGLYVSEIFPNVATCVDDMCFVHSLKSDSNDHGAATLQMNTGKIQPGRPSVGAWTTYGLGTVNQNLPAFMVMTNQRNSANWSNGFLPAVYQGNLLRTQGAPFPDLKPYGTLAPGSQRARLDLLAEINREHQEAYPGETELEARTAAYELAYRMQVEAPQAVNIAGESPATLAMYGMNTDRTRDFGRKCLLARRMVERGVRFIQIWHDGWDAHSNIAENHRRNAEAIDRPIAGLMKDLKQRGLLDSTLIVWAGEFGRTPSSQNDGGRDHHSAVHTFWMAGGGVRGGTAVGSSDELGQQRGSNPCEVRDLHATLLNLMGLDNMALTYLYNGRYQRLTETGGNVIRGVIA